LITVSNVVLDVRIQKSRLQEVIHGQTPLIVPEIGAWLGQKLTDRTTRIEEFKR